MAAVNVNRECTEKTLGLVHQNIQGWSDEQKHQLASNAFIETAINTLCQPNKYPENQIIAAKKILTYAESKQNSLIMDLVDN